MEATFVNNNGAVLKNEGKTIETGNRGYLYGDGLFETIRVLDGKPLSLDIHLHRLKEGMETLKMRVPSFFTVEFFKERIIELLKKSKITKGGKIRLSVDRLSGGTYRPITNEVSYFIEVYPLKQNSFALNEKGKEIELYTEMRKHKTPCAPYKTKNAMLSVMASIKAQENSFDDMLLTNDNNQIIEGTSTNVFIVSNGTLYTPGLDQGCVGGIMRMTIINIALKNGIKVYEAALHPKNLLMADEVFLTNAVQGIVWVGNFRTKTYKNDMAKRLVQLLKEHYIVAL